MESTKLSACAARSEGNWATMLNDVLCAVGKLGALATSVYPEPAVLTIRFENLAVPPLTVPDVVPDSVDVFPFCCRVKLTVPLESVAGLPLLSSRVTVTAGAIAPPAVESEGCEVNASFAGGSVIV